MAHRDFPFIHERAKASLDSKIIDKWDADLENFLDTMTQHKQMPEPKFSIYIQQYVDDATAGSSNYTEDMGLSNPESKTNPTSLSDATYVTQVFCSPDITIAELKQVYYQERVRALKRRAKAAFYRRVETEGGKRKLEQILEKEEQDKLALGDEYIDPLTIVLPEEMEQCSYEWGFLTVEAFEEAEARREKRARLGRFVPARVAVTNFRYGGQYMKDYHTLEFYGVPPGANLIHTRRFPEPSDLL